MCLTDCEASQLGGVLGRVSNGIKGASFVLNGTDYSVTDSTVGWDKVIYIVYISISQIIFLNSSFTLYFLLHCH